MNARQIIFEDFGIDLPIGGGIGNSIDSPIKILFESYMKGDFVEVEYQYIKHVCIGRGVKWKLLGQELIIEDNRAIDKITIETVQETETEIITQKENYYFDISNLHGIFL